MVLASESCGCMSTAQESSQCITNFVRNPHIPAMEEDYLYHLGLGTKTHDLPAMFGDVKLERQKGNLEAANLELVKQRFNSRRDTSF